VAVTELYAFLMAKIMKAPEPDLPSIVVLSISPRDPKPDPDAVISHMRKIWINREARYRAMYRVTK
jgi:hypothetical protein